MAAPGGRQPPAARSLIAKYDRELRSLIAKYDRELRALDGAGLTDVEMDLALQRVLDGIDLLIRSRAE